LINVKEFVARFGTKSNLYFGKNSMMGGCNGLQIHSYINNFDVFISFFCKASKTHAIEI
jgi:hypothetical protein